MDWRSIPDIIIAINMTDLDFKNKVNRFWKNSDPLDTGKK